MKMIHQFFLRLFSSPQESNIILSEERSFFDYSSAEKIKLLRAAGREAQKQQQQLLKAYEARYGRTA